jgi:hypothetical protein
MKGKGRGLKTKEFKFPEDSVMLQRNFVCLANKRGLLQMIDFPVGGTAGYSSAADKTSGNSHLCAFASLKIQLPGENRRRPERKKIIKPGPEGRESGREPKIVRLNRKIITLSSCSSCGVFGGKARVEIDWWKKFLRRGIPRSAG